MKIAVVGCSHGALDEIYSTMRKHEGSTGDKVDLLLCCGDFEVGASRIIYSQLEIDPFST